MEAQSSPASCWSNIVKQNPPPQPPHHHDVAASATATSGQGVPVASCKSTKGIAVAVVDANAIIQGGQSLSNSADRFVSVSEVITEVRDPTSRHSLNFLPFSVDILEPSPDALKKVINFARATGDLQTLSDVDLKLIALTYTLEAQIHGTQHLRDSPPPIQAVNVKRLPEKDMPGWGSNVPNPEEWEALEHVANDGSNLNSKILPLKDLNLNVISKDEPGIDDGLMGNDGESYSEGQADVDGALGKQTKYLPVKKEVKIEGKKMVADGIDATQGQFDENGGDWLPAVSRSTRRRFLRRKARREMYEVSSEKDDNKDTMEDEENDKHDGLQCPHLLVPGISADDVPYGKLEESETIEAKNGSEDISKILHQMRLEEESVSGINDSKEADGTYDNSEDGTCELKDMEINHEGSENLDMASQNSESTLALHMDDNSSEQSWTLRSLSESTVACVTSDYAMQNVLLQMGLRLLAPGGMQIRELHRWVLKCHACYKVTTDVGRIFCPSCGNGGTLRKVAVTIGENGIILAARRSRVSVRGTKFSLPLPQGGRVAITKNPILREDQIPQKFLYPKTKKKNKQGDDFYVPGDIFLHHNDKRAPLQPPVRKALSVFSGKRNPNDNHYSRAKH